ncbi:peritrophin-1 [Cylas formicarius]|uniref:peritrophin-1 n=1 Tax=Cylas formicarius TaxID=197179 RepID=UPI002958771B|nr:peritrophin-1 [Cylas formicarius]
MYHFHNIFYISLICFVGGEDSEILTTIWTTQTLTPTRQMTTTSATTISTTPASSPTCTSNKVEFYPDPQDCSSFYECVNGQISKHRCPDGQSWDPEFVACNFSHEVNCGSRPKEHYPNCPSEGVSYFPDLEDCSGFYICINGKTGHLTCPDQLSWSTDHEECLITENVDCGLRPSMS